MTQLYSAGVTKVTTAAAGPIATLVAPSTCRPDVREIGLFVSSAVAPVIGLGRPAAVGAGALTGSLGQAMDPNDPAATCTLTTSFATTQPTAPAIPLYRMSLPAVVGAGFVWTFGVNELTISPSGNFVIWQFSAAIVTYDLFAKWEE